MAAYGLGGVAEGAEEGAAHALPVGEAGFPGDDFDGVAALFHHQPRGFDTQALDRFGGGLAGFGAEGAAELARAEVCGLREVFHR